MLAGNSSVVRKGEDRLVVDVDQGLYGVFDGHMGYEASDFASQFFPKAFQHHKSMIPSDQEEDLKLALRLALQDTETKLHELSNTCGTTACVAAITPRLVVVANIGDSRAIVYGRGANGRMRVVKKLSEDHHPSSAAERQRIIAAGGDVEGKRMWIPGGESLAVSRALGDRKFKEYGLSAEPEFQVWKRPASDKCWYLLLATDGLFDRLNEARVGEVMEQGENEQAMAENIASAAEDVDRRAKSSVIVLVPPEFEGPLPTPVEGGDDISIVVVSLNQTETLLRND